MRGAGTGQEEKSGVVATLNRDGASRVILVCEHASSFIPAEYDGLGLTSDLQRSHIAWDPGAFSVAGMLSERLDAPLIYQTVSRLLYDCNRPPDADSAIPSVSEIHNIPGNNDLSAAEKALRVERFYQPFKNALTDLVDERSGAGPDPVIVTVHTFTPSYSGRRRHLDIGILHDVDSRLADAVLAVMQDSSSLDVRRNEPYGPEDGVTHTLAEHAVPRRLLNVMIEIRNDLVADEETQKAMGLRLADCLNTGLKAVSSGSAGLETSEMRKRG